MGVLALACLAGWYGTGTAPSNRPRQRNGKAVDSQLLESAHAVAESADSSREQELAREALRVADREYDTAFLSGLRETAAAGAPEKGPLKEIADRIARAKAQIATDQGRITELAKKAETDENAADQLQIAKAQLALDQDELEDAQADLERRGGDSHTKLQRAQQEHEAAEHQNTPQFKPPRAPSLGTVAEQVDRWTQLDTRHRELDAARAQALARAAALSREHDLLEKLISKQNTDAAPADEDTAGILDRLSRLSDQRKTLTELDRRIQDCQQLADVYQRWASLAELRRNRVLHVLLLSLAGILGIILAALVANRAVRRAFAKQNDRRRLHHLRVIATIAIQGAAAALILLAVFGMPTQTSTIIGLATAGLTVALKDFIVAFFGWFALIGKNGIRVGDWVEIEGVSGEVIEIGVLKTVLLEMGDWANTGHPTGRRVAFMNKFAIENHYFNFSTAGQWLWDELALTLPFSADNQEQAMRIRDVVERETAADAALAEQEWERVTRQYGTKPFSAKPVLNLRPSVNGVDVIVRYITRAPQRSQVKSRLFAAMMELLHRPAHATTNP